MGGLCSCPWGLPIARRSRASWDAAPLMAGARGAAPAVLRAAAAGLGLVLMTNRHGVAGFLSELSFFHRFVSRWAGP